MEIQTPPMTPSVWFPPFLAFFHESIQKATRLAFVREEAVFATAEIAPKTRSIRVMNWVSPAGIYEAIFLHRFYVRPLQRDLPSGRLSAEIEGETVIEGSLGDFVIPDIMKIETPQPWKKTQKLFPAVACQDAHAFANEKRGIFLPRHTTVKVDLDLENVTIPYVLEVGMVAATYSNKFLKNEDPEIVG